jgi:hypothetical protein
VKKNPFWFLALTALCITVTFAFLVLSVRRSSPIGQAGCDRISRGMSEAEVEKILGEPTESWGGPLGLITWFPEPPARKYWMGKTGTAMVYFDQAGKVMHVQFAPAIDRESFLDRIRRWSRL